MRGYVHFPSRSNNKIIIFVNGYQTSLSNGNRVQNYISAELIKNGFIIYRFDALGYGESDGDYENALPSNIKENLLTLIEKILIEFPDSEIIPIGTSMGGMIVNSLLQENRIPNIRKSILLCPALDFYNIYQSSKFIETDIMPMQIFDYISYKNKFIGDLKNFIWDKKNENLFVGDTLIIHGSNDEIVEFDTIKNYAYLNSIEFIEIKGADHTFKSNFKGHEGIKKNNENINLIIKQIIKFGGK